MALDGFAHHGVLAHQDDGVAAERDADLLHLLGADIVSVDLKLFNERCSFPPKHMCHEYKLC
jgi:hypothetical protein